MVGGGVGARFGGDKLFAQIAGEPLVVHTMRAVRPRVDACVLVCRDDQLGKLSNLDLAVDLAVGGDTRTDSEYAGLNALDGYYELIGIHDAARPVITGELIDRLFAKAESHGGAIPVVPQDLLIERLNARPLIGAVAAQTPQVFRGSELSNAFRLAKEAGFQGHDTADLVSRFTETEIVAVEGSPDNLKVTYPADLERIAELIRRTARNEPR